MLDELVENICDDNAEKDSLDFYIKSEQCCIECLTLLEGELLQDEKAILQQAGEVWFGTYDSHKIDELNTAFSGRYGARENTTNRKSALQAAQCVVMSFEKWSPDEQERPYVLDYCVFYLKNTGVKDEDLFPIIKKYFC